MAAVPSAGAIASDPPVSEPQRRAMFAAAAGNSTLGIPKEVGEEFVGKLGDQNGLAFLGSLKGFLRNLLSWAAEEENEAEHASEPEAGDRQDALPPAGPALTAPLNAANDAADSAMALDQNSVRSKDLDGRLHVAQANISKATVNPYRGDEIPDWEGLGLDPDKTYQLLRHPDELAKAAPSFNNLAILSEHRPISAADHPPELVIGSSGTDAVFDPPYLKNSLVFWPQEAIDQIENGQKRELSAAYRYTADMTPGVYEGMPHDGVMRDIIGQHIACVPEGRVGHDVVVGDAKPAAITEESAMRIDLKAPKLVAAWTAFRGKHKLAQDANIEEILPLIETIAGMANGGNGEEPPPADQDPMATLPSGAAPMGSQDQEETDEEKEARIKKDCRAADARRRLGRDETDEEREKREGEDSAADAAAAADKAAGDQRAVINSAKDVKAMDAATIAKTVNTAVAAAVKRAQQTAQETREAERAVRPYVGEMTIAFDSAEGVYRKALQMLGVDIAGVHPSALPTILAMQPKPGARREERVAMDAATVAGFAERFPEAAKIRIVG